MSRQGNRSARVPAVVYAAYPHLRAAGTHPVVAQTYAPERGWRPGGWRKRVTVSWCRTLRREGVTVVALAVDGRLADFTIRELLR